MSKDYYVSYNVVFLFNDWDDEDIRNQDLVAERLADTMHEWLQQGGTPYPDEIKVELA